VLPRIINGSVTEDFPAVGMVGTAAGYSCTGTLIAPQWVLTAAHCVHAVKPTEALVRFNGVTYSSVRILVHPKTDLSEEVFGSDPANDIALVELAQEVAGVAPLAIFRGTPAVGQVVTLVGYGSGGGPGGAAGGYGLKRVGTTPLDFVTVRLIGWDFDDPGESNTAPGDSGGPVLVWQDGQYYVAGVVSGGELEDGRLGDRAYNTRVDAYAAWLDAMMEGDLLGDDDHGDAFNNPTPIALGATVFGSIESAQDQDWFVFTATRRDTVKVVLRNLDGLDPYLAVYNGKGRRIRFNNDDAGNPLRSVVQFDVKPGKTYYLVACGYEDSTGDYRLRVRSLSLAQPRSAAVPRGGRVADHDHVAAVLLKQAGKRRAGQIADALASTLAWGTAGP
jgi:hypothetical protein